MTSEKTVPVRPRIWIVSIVVSVAWLLGDFSTVLLVAFPMTLLLTRLGEKAILGLFRRIEDDVE